jgi:hypothetical protein
LSTAYNSDSWTVSVHTSIADIYPEQWDICAGSANPYLWHSHLLALEESGIATPENGFCPRHVTLWDHHNQMIAAAPAYLKSHSKGELGIDLGLAMAHDRAIGPYYPKLQVEVPMTPISGPRLLVRDGVDKMEAWIALLAALRRQAVMEEASSVQIAYMTEREWDFAETADFIKSEGNAYVWRNKGAENFDSFLMTMHSRGRSKIRRERRKVLAENLAYVQYNDDQIKRELAEDFFKLYAATYRRNETDLWHNEAYFAQIFDKMPEVQDLTFAYRDGELIAMQHSFLGEDAIYAQHWGQIDNVRFLHFEMGLYQTIEAAIRDGRSAVNFGTTGQHKVERGVGAEPVHHAMWFRSADFREIAELGLQRKKAAAQSERFADEARLPFQEGLAREGGA